MKKIKKIIVDLCKKSKTLRQIARFLLRKKQNSKYKKFEEAFNMRDDSFKKLTRGTKKLIKDTIRENKEEIKDVLNKVYNSDIKKVLVLSQTTYSIEKFNVIVDFIKEELEEKKSWYPN